MLDRPHTHGGGLQAMPPKPLPIAELVLGKPVEEVAVLVPRLFNLCRAAQTVAVRMALGLPVEDDEALGREIAREHILRLAVILPTRLGLAPLAIPGQDSEVPGALFGGERFAATPGEFEAFLASDLGIAPVLSALRERFEAGQAVTGVLPDAADEALFEGAALENSVAARHLDHPVMEHIEAQYGRGPLWRVVGRALDLQLALDGALPEARLTGNGGAVVPAARGVYAVVAHAEGGKVTAFRRVTPTDHMLAPEGIMQQSLASLPVAKHDQAALLVDILDPCSPIELKGVVHA